MTEEAVEKVEQPKKEKKEKVPKEPRLSKKWTKESWGEHLSGLQKDVVPEGWLNMAEIVKKAVEEGITRSRICSAMGGDRVGSAPWHPVFEVVYVGGRKFGSPEILTTGFALLKDPEFHKTERKGRPRKEKIEGNVGNKPVKLKKVNSADKVWVASGSRDPNTGEVVTR